MLPSLNQWSKVSARFPGLFVYIYDNTLYNLNYFRCFNFIAVRGYQSTISDFGLSEPISTKDHTVNGVAISGITKDPFFKDIILPVKCVGCGSRFQTVDPSKYGYIDDFILRSSHARGKIYWPEIRGKVVESVPDGVNVERFDERFTPKRKRVICKRCYRLQYYKRVDEDKNAIHRPTIAENRESESRILIQAPKRDKDIIKLPIESGIDIANEGYKSVHTPEIISRLVYNMKENSVVIYVLDLTNIEITMVPELYLALSSKRLDVIFILNKADVLPKDTDVQKIKMWSRRLIKHLSKVHNENVIVCSSTTGLGFDKLERRLGHYLANNKYIYVVGSVNAGKSTLVNMFLSYVGYKEIGTLFNKRAVGGITRSYIPGTTLGEVTFGLGKGMKLVDTPGIPVGCQISSILPKSIDLSAIAITKRIQPVKVILEEYKSLIIGALVRIDNVKGCDLSVLCYTSEKVTYKTCKSVKAQDLIRDNGAVSLHPPFFKEDLESLGGWSTYEFELDTKSCDIVVPSLGWFSLYGKGPKTVNIHLPSSVKLFKRPVMIPPSGAKDRRIYLSSRGRSYKLHKLKKSMLKFARETKRREALNEGKTQ